MTIYTFSGPSCRALCHTFMVQHLGLSGEVHDNGAAAPTGGPDGREPSGYNGRRVNMRTRVKRCEEG